MNSGDKRALVIAIVFCMVVISLAMFFMRGAFAQGSVSGNCSHLEPVYGDANEDLGISMGDITKIERIILGLDPLTKGADANQNSVVDMGDVVKVERQVLGLDPIYGDANSDKNIDYADINKVQRIILGIEPSTLGADANCDGMVNMGDVTWIQRMLCGVD